MLVLWLAACGAFRDCEEIDIRSVSELPERLSEAGLFLDLQSEALDPLVLPYDVRFALWTDGADKRRWLRLPDGAAIDTSQPDDWVFPVGTRLFKEFSRDGVRIETRMIERLDSGWGAVAYRWLPDGSDAVALPEGEDDSGGTAHDVPEAALCVACHGGRQGFVLGFSAVQLSSDEGLLGELHTQGLLTDPVAVELPGDELDQEALGYLHANCSHCHNAEREVGMAGSRCYDPYVDIDFTLPSAAASVEELPAITSADAFLGDSRQSTVLHKMSRRNRSLFDPSMPPLGTEEIDPSGLDLMTRWISRR
jgi:hypothetical protein